MKYKLTIYFVSQLQWTKRGHSMTIAVEVSDIMTVVKGLIANGYPQEFDEKKGTGLARAVAAVEWERINGES